MTREGQFESAIRGTEVTVEVHLRFLYPQAIQFHEAVLFPIAEEAETVQEFLAPVTAADRPLATEPYFVLSE